MCLQLQLTQKTSVPPQEPVSIIVPIIYDMASGTTQQADIPRQQNSSVAAPMMVSNILKRFAEMNPPRQGTWAVDGILLHICYKNSFERDLPPLCSSSPSFPTLLPNLVLALCCHGPLSVCLSLSFFLTGSSFFVHFSAAWTSFLLAIYYWDWAGC